MRYTMDLICKKNKKKIEKEKKRNSFIYVNSLPKLCYILAIKRAQRAQLNEK